MLNILSEIQSIRTLSSGFRKNQVKSFLGVFAVLILFFISCDNAPSSADEEIVLPARIVANRVLDDFIQESKKYGFDFSKDSIEIELLDEIYAYNTSGFCGISKRREGVIRIDTNHVCWNSFPNKETILYHELGHYFLGHGHTNHLMSPLEKGSFMNPNALNLYHEDETDLRDYYISQLFNADRRPPFFAETGKEWEIEELKNGDFKRGLENWNIRNHNSGYQIELSDDVFSGESPSLKISNYSNHQLIRDTSFVIDQILFQDESLIIDQLFKVEKEIPYGSAIEFSFDAWVREINYGDIKGLHNIIAVRFSSQDYNRTPSFLLRKDFVAETSGFQNYKLIVPYYLPFDDSISVKLAFVNGVEGEAYFDNFKLTVKER